MSNRRLLYWPHEDPLLSLPLNWWLNNLWKYSLLKIFYCLGEAEYQCRQGSDFIALFPHFSIHFQKQWVLRGVQKSAHCIIAFHSPLSILQCSYLQREAAQCGRRSPGARDLDSGINPAVNEAHILKWITSFSTTINIKHQGWTKSNHLRLLRL